MPATKKDFPVEQVRRYLEPGPVVLVSSRWLGKSNIMTMGWHTVMEFTPSLVGFVIASSNRSFQIIRQTGECVINLPTTKLTDIVVGIGNCSGTEVDKFEKFGLTPLEAVDVDAPLIKECHANFKCRLHDDALVDKYNFFIFEVVKAHVAATPKHPETRCAGRRRFPVAPETIAIDRLDDDPRYAGHGPRLVRSDGIGGIEQLALVCGKHGDRGQPQDEDDADDGDHDARESTPEFRSCRDGYGFAKHLPAFSQIAELNRR